MKYLLSIFFICFLSEIRAQLQISVSDSSAYFDGLNDYFDLGSSASLDFEHSDTFAISLWIKIPAASSGIDEIITKIGGPDLPGWGLQLRNKQVEFFAVSSFQNQEWYFIRAPITLSSDRWHHIVFNYEGATGLNSNCFIINGIIVNNPQVIINTLNGSIKNSGAAQIGHYDGNGQQAGPEWFVGNMDELKVWDKVISEAEVRTNMHNIDSTIDPGLISWWQFNNFSNDTLRDIVNNNHGIANGGIVLNKTYAPVGIASSETWLETANINLYNLEIELNYSNPLGLECFGARIYSESDFQNLNPLDTSYLVLHRDGQGPLDLSLIVRNLSGLDSSDVLNPCQVKLYRRDIGGGIWTYVADANNIEFSLMAAYFDINELHGQYLVVRDFCLGFSEEENQIPKLKLAPNPGSQEIKILGVENLIKVEMYNSAGHKIFTFKSETIDVSGLPTGQYFLKVFEPKQIRRLIFIKE